MSFAIFLDVDGVLNRKGNTYSASPDGNVGVSEFRIKILAKAIKKYGEGDIVLTSDWKNTRIGDDLDYLKEKLSEQDLKISGATEDNWKDRGQGVLNYLKEHPEIDEYVILDDHEYDFEDFPKLWERLLLTNGIEKARFASKTPAVEAQVFYSFIEEVSE